MIPRDLLSTCPHRQFHTLPGLLDSWAALPNSYPNALRAMQGGSPYHFHDGLWYDPAVGQTHALPYERRMRQPLSQPDMVCIFACYLVISYMYNLCIIGFGIPLDMECQRQKCVCIIHINGILKL